MKIADVDFNIAPGGSGRSKYEQGVSLEMSPLFDFYKEPWVLLKHLVRELTVAHLAVKYTDMELLPRNLTLVDAGCGFCELSALLKRARKVGGFRLDYIGIDIDEDKQRVSKLIEDKVLEVKDIPAKKLVAEDE